MWKSISVAVAIVAAVSIAHAQQDIRLTDITGTWVMNLESHQLGLELEQKGSKVEGVLHAMGTRILLVGTYADRKLELKGERAEDQLPHAGNDAGRLWRPCSTTARSRASCRPIAGARNGPANG